MKYRITFAPEAREDYHALPAHHRAEVRDAINQLLQFQPAQLSKSRIKRLRGLERPQYRLRVRDIRVFYDIRGDEVEVLGIVDKPQTAAWLQKWSVSHENNRPS